MDKLRAIVGDFLVSLMSRKLIVVVLAAIPLVVNKQWGELRTLVIAYLGANVVEKKVMNGNGADTQPAPDLAEDQDPAV